MNQLLIVQMLVWRVPEQATRATWSLWANLTSLTSNIHPQHCLQANITL